MLMPKAQIMEIFSSVQGEGIFVGARQIFVRFKKCNMACEFCDTPNDGPSKEYSPTALMNEIKDIDKSSGPHHSVSLTGGEPLVYTEFLKVFLPFLKKENFKSYLETNGTLPNELEAVVDMIDIVAMDFKLPSSTGQKELWKEHSEFLKIASAKKVFVKAVITADTTKDDVEKAMTLIKKVKDTIPFVLQPATPVRGRDKAVDSSLLLGFLEIGLKHKLETIRVIPQVHKVLGVK